MLNEFPIFDYEDIQLIPNKCVIKSRAEADTSVTLGNHTFKLPVVPANMQTILDEGEQFKEYYGSASQYQKGAYKNVEGKRILLPAKGHLQDTLTEMEQDLQSAISYAGGRQVADLKHVDYVIVKNSIWNGDASH
ncbi:GMP reductase [Streptococcus pneumoniae]|uniref:hypothetical protein n=1 Tax=Streptococcus pneumoniae TaxID=1313 RepID=UPI0005DC5CEB|nr:hypothetical protein [Streptococcus pneumoniae]COT26188.1 GMP reductase [Streptococcus pneumoniae]